MWRLAALGMLLVSLLLVATAGGGSFPGRPGRLVASLNLDGRLLTVRPDGSGLRVLPSIGDNASYSPDGEQLSFVSNLGGDLSIARKDGSQKRRILRGAVDAAWSPDGSTLAVVRPDWTIDFVTTGGRRFNGPAPKVLVRSVAWSPDGSRLAFGTRERTGSGALFVVRVDQDDAVAIVREPEGINVYFPKWSPDGRRITFTETEGCRGETCGGPSYISVVDVDGSHKRRLTEGDGSAWSPEGGRIAFGDKNGISMVRLRDRSISTVTSTGPIGATIDWQPGCTRRGGAGDDRLQGSSGADVLCGLAGNDVLRGGLGNDRLFGEAGNDTFYAKDGRFDVIGCGPGVDTVVADRRDLIGRDCERVRKG